MSSFAHTGYTNFFGSGSGGSTGFGSPSFNQYYDLYHNAPMGQGMPTIEKGIEQGTIRDLGGGMYGLPMGGPRAPGSSAGSFRDQPMRVYDRGELEGIFSRNRGRAQFMSALMGDYQNMVEAGKMHGQRVDQALGNMQQAYAGGAQNIRQSGIDAYEDLTGRGDQFMAQGDQFLQDQTQFNKDVLERSDQLYKESIDDYEKTTGADASSMKFGMARQRGQQRNQLSAAAKRGDPMAQAALQQMDFETAQQTQAVMTQVASTFNQTKASMAAARAQNYGQVGMQAASNINQAGAVKANFANMAKGMYEQGVAMKQGAETLANQFYAQGQTAIADRIIANPGSPVSMASVFSALFAFDMTPGSGSLTGMPSEFLGFS